MDRQGEARGGKRNALRIGNGERIAREWGGRPTITLHVTELAPFFFRILPFLCFKGVR